MTADAAPETAHDHGAGDFYLEQLLSVAVCGAFAAVAVLMYARDMLKFMLVPQFHPWVLGGGIALGLLTLVRVVALWRASRPEDHTGHDHAPGEACNHGGHVHGPDCGHDHADGHEHGSIFWRVVVMMFPVALFVMGLPNEGFSAEAQAKMLGNDATVQVGDVSEKADAVQRFNFADLSASALDGETREQMTGRKVLVKGQMRRKGDKALELFYFKMSCCAADQIPLKAQMFTKESLMNLPVPDMQWVEVTGVLQFAPLANGQYIPVIRTSVTQIAKSTPE